MRGEIEWFGHGGSACGDMAYDPSLRKLGRMSSGRASLPLPAPPGVRWRNALDNLSPHASPCRSLMPARGATMREDAIAFCDQFGAEAFRLG